MADQPKATIPIPSETTQPSSNSSQTTPHNSVISSRSKEPFHSFLLPSSPKSPEPKSPKLVTVNHRSCCILLTLSLVQFIDNGENRTDEVYTKTGIEFHDGSLSPPSLPKLQVMPRIESNHLPLKDSQSEEHPEQNQKALWNAMYIILIDKDVVILVRICLVIRFSPF